MSSITHYLVPYTPYGSYIMKKQSALEKPSVMNAGCGSRMVLDRIADKWTALIIHVLSSGTKRHNELRRQITGVSQKMLTQTLRSLENDGLVERKVYPVVPPKVEYRLTPARQDAHRAAGSHLQMGGKAPVRTGSRAQPRVQSFALMSSLNPTSAPASNSLPSGASKRLLPWLVAVAFFMESLDTTILNTAVPAIAQALEGGAAEHEVGAGQLHVEPGGIHPDQRLDGGPLRHAPRVCVGHRPVHAGVVALRNFEQHPSAGGVPHSARLRRSHDGAGGPADAGADLRQIRTDPRHELRRHSRRWSVPCWGRSRAA